MADQQNPAHELTADLIAAFRLQKRSLEEALEELGDEPTIGELKKAILESTI